MEPKLSATIRDVRQRRLRLKQASKILLIQANKETESGGALSELLCVFAKEMEEMLDDIEALYKSSYVQTQDIGALAQTILDLPELKEDKKLRRKIFTEFRNVSNQLKINNQRE